MKHETDAEQSKAGNFLKKYKKRTLKIIFSSQIVHWTSKLYNWGLQIWGSGGGRAPEPLSFRIR